MSQFKPNDKVWVEATYDRDYNEARSTIAIKDAHTCYPVGNGFVMVVPLSSIHRDPTEELERLRASVSHFSGLVGEETEKRYALEEELTRLRAYVELQPCECLHVAASCMGTECDRCRALGKEKS